MLVTENDNGTYRITSESEIESHVVIIIHEMAVLAFEDGEMSEDDINDHGCFSEEGLFLNYCTIPDMSWVIRLMEECE